MPNLRLVFRLVPIAALLLPACAETPAGPADPQSRLSTSIAPAEMTVQALPIPPGWQGAPKAVAGNGAVFATNDGLATRPLVAWIPPFTGQPIVIAANSSVGSAGAANALGDVVAFPFGGGAKGAWLQATATSWSFVPHPMGSYLDVSAHVINDSREMAGFVRETLASGGSQLRAAYFPIPGADPVLLPLPGPSSFVGTMVNSMNNSGDIVGFAFEAVGTGRNATTYLRAAIWHRTGALSWNLELLPPLSLAANSSAHGINDAGQIAGYDGVSLVRWTPDGSGGWTREQISPSGNVSQIDACGRVVGTAPIGGKNDRAFVWDGGLNVLPLPGAATRSGGNDITTELATGRGVIVGWAAKGGQASYPVRWTFPGCP